MSKAKRLAALERRSANAPNVLSVLVPDDTTDEELEAIRATGQAVFRESDPEAGIDDFIG